MLHYKKYDTYDDYLEDQVAKANLREAKIRLKSERKYTDFIKDFSRYGGFIRPKDRIICLGARFGEEVRAFRDRGYPEAMGIDLFGEEEGLVVKGDWNHMPFGDGTFDIVYTNSIDHSYNLETEIKEIKRVLKSDGKMIIALDCNHTAGTNTEKVLSKLANPERYEAVLWNEDNDVIKPFIDNGFAIGFAWRDRRWHTYLLERKNGKTV